jgi:hypothetical protein
VQARAAGADNEALPFAPGQSADDPEEARMDDDVYRYRELAQPFCDDVVLAAGCFRVNATGSWELAGFAAMSQRQLLKSRSAYLAERVLLAVTPVEVVAIALGVGARLRPRRCAWSHSELQVRAVPSRVGLGPAALWLTARGALPRLEIAPAAPVPAAAAVVAKLEERQAGRV